MLMADGSMQSQPARDGVSSIHRQRQPTHLVLFGNGFNVIHHLKAQRRIQPTGRLVEKQNPWIRHEPTCDAQPLFLSSTEPLLDGCSNNGVDLPLKTEARNQVVDSLHPFFGRDIAVGFWSARHQTYLLKRGYLGNASPAANFMVSLTVKLPINASSCST